MADDTGAATVVIVGGGYGGITVTKALDAEADVVLVEPKDAFFHNIAALRGLVDPRWLEKVFIPYDRLLDRGTVVRDRAVAVDGSSVALASGEASRADFVVLATGSTYPFPAKSEVDDSAEASLRIRVAHDALEASSRVLLLGAGPVGVELAGEIHAVWPEKAVTLLDRADDVIGDRFSPALRAELRRQLVEIGVELALGSPLVSNPPTAPGEAGAFTVTTQAGRSVTADIWFRCYGVAPVSDYLTGPLAAARRADGFVTVNDLLQVPGHDHVFAIGDVSTADAKMAAFARGQAEVVAANIAAMARGDGERTAYEPRGPVIAVPIGPEGGAGQFPGSDDVAGPELIARAKGRDLAVERYAELLGRPPAP